VICRDILTSIFSLRERGEPGQDDGFSEPRRYPLGATSSWKLLSWHLPSSV